MTLSSAWCLRGGARIVADARAVAGPAGTISAAISRTRSGAFEARLRLTPTSAVGGYDVFLAGADCRGRQYAPGSAAGRLGAFEALNPTAVTLDARPEPARRGQPVVAAGAVRHLVGGRLAAWAGVEVVVEFRPRGEQSFLAVGTATTDARGAFTLSSTATVDGLWRVRYAGGADHAPASATDHVDVR